MKFRIRKGSHRAFPPVLGLWKNKRVLVREVIFHEDCIYSLPSEDMADVNKLFGIGYLKGFHHKDSVRFGWSFNPDRNNILISAYCYVDGQRVIEDIMHVPLNRKLRLSITLIQDFYYMKVEAPLTTRAKSIKFTHKKVWSYPLGLYFGENNDAPNTMHVTINKL